MGKNADEWADEAEGLWKQRAVAGREIKEELNRKEGGQNSSVGSVLGSLSCVMQHHGFEPPLSLRYRGFFPWS